MNAPSPTGNSSHMSDAEQFASRLHGLERSIQYLTKHPSPDFANEWATRLAGASGWLLTCATYAEENLVAQRGTEDKGTEVVPSMGVSKKRKRASRPDTHAGKERFANKGTTKLRENIAPPRIPQPATRASSDLTQPTSTHGPPKVYAPPSTPPATPSITIPQPPPNRDLSTFLERIDFATVKVYELAVERRGNIHTLAKHFGVSRGGGHVRIAERIIVKVRVG